ncbi:site-2 protease family protein [Candidatus Wolfebacteria bacterium CG10_big_fil_rev_8_21_14_0_10_31_9]|uniref:Site-2 protease family protein n=1 Tax=Candidatus Wolfebacteria bacterium CG10_big_fil_rev_8_21_14_0_10_31_9 TaxID=1975070 RepID=A0A2H0RC35_9BACT|nr:MAG: site-2 protease family protein [Candidatus Wolfebacteria bacterium CG10_big_fil_rev_8_21_14_0_10_31_9]
MNPFISIFQLIVLIFSVIIHEVSHGFVANRLGDPTAKDAGRLTLNPIKHIDPIGSILLPLVLYIFNSPILFGWAKPVPFNPYNLKNPKRDSGLIGMSGPASNFLVVIIFSIILKLVGFISAPFVPALIIFLNIIILVNLVLGIFNLVPIPPLDGSKVLFSFLPAGAVKIERFLEQYGMFILLFFIFFGFQAIIPIVLALYHLLGGSLF